MPARRDVGQEDAELAVPHLAQGAAVLPRHPYRLPPLLREAAFVDHEDALRGGQPRPDVGLQALDDRLCRPGRLCEQALQGAWCSARDHLGHVLGVAPVRLLDQQAPYVLLAALARFLAPKERSKLLMKGGKGGRHPVKLGLIHSSSLLIGEFILKPSLQY